MVTPVTEDEWLAWPALRDAPLLVLPAVQGRVVVVAPHPDDETLALGGTMQRLADEGWEVEVVAVTDSEASHAVPGGPPALAAVRDAERGAALRALGLGGVAVHRLGLPDTGVAGHADDLCAALVGLLDGAAWCLATDPCDVHHDHQAVGVAAGLACAAADVPLATYPVWTWHLRLPGDPAVGWHRLRRVPLGLGQRRRKAAAVAAFASQIEPPSPGVAAILEAGLLARFARPFEVVFAP